MQGNCVLSRASANICLEELIKIKTQNIQPLTRGPTEFCSRKAAHYKT
jgi:hypothetical protein